MAEGGVDVGHTQNKAGRLVTDLRDECEFRNDERPELVRHELDLRFRERHKPPILFPRLIVNLAKPSAFFANIPEVSGPDSHRAALPKTLGQWSQTRRSLCRISEPPSVPILRFCKTAALDQVLVVWRIVRGQYGGRKLKSIDQQATNVIG